MLTEVETVLTKQTSGKKSGLDEGRGLLNNQKLVRLGRSYSQGLEFVYVTSTVSRNNQIYHKQTHMRN